MLNPDITCDPAPHYLEEWLRFLHAQCELVNQAQEVSAGFTDVPPNITAFGGINEKARLF